MVHGITSAVWNNTLMRNHARTALVLYVVTALMHYTPYSTCRGYNVLITAFITCTCISHGSLLHKKDLCTMSTLTKLIGVIPKHRLRYVKRE